MFFYTTKSGCPDSNRGPRAPEARALPTEPHPAIYFCLIVYNTLLMAETLKELNDQAIKGGLLLPDGQSSRKDFSWELGKPLCPLEKRFYRFISKLTPQGPVPIKVLIEKFYSQDDEIFDNDKQAVYQLAARVKKKLGETAIINKHGLGYLSRRILIDISVPAQNRTEI